MAIGTVSLREDRFHGDKPYKVDREKGVIYGVKVLGEQSANGRRYTRQAMTSAARLYEGIKVNLNHPSSGKATQPRDVMDRFGKLVNVHTDTGGLYADLHYISKHPAADFITEAAEKMPDAIGLSHNAEGKVFKRGTEHVVEEINSVRHVDIVADPATTNGLFEERQMEKKLSEVIAGLEQKSAARVFLQEMADAGMVAPDAAMPAPSTPEEALKSGFKAAIHAIVDDDGMDLVGKVAKIKELLKMQEKATGAGEKPKEEPAEKKETPESKQPSADVKALQDKLALMERKDKVRELCDAAGVKPSKALTEALLNVSDETAKALIEEQKALPTGKTVSKPRSAGLTESRGGGNDQLPSDPKELKRALFS